VNGEITWSYTTYMPVPVAARFKAYVYGRSLAAIVGSNPSTTEYHPHVSPRAAHRVFHCSLAAALAGSVPGAQSATCATVPIDDVLPKGICV
jgi:hypothetical protein